MSAGRRILPTPQAAAPIDLTGNWVSVVTEDWRWRMVTPPKGDFASVPLNPEGTKVANSWDPATDGSCLAYGAAGLIVVCRSSPTGLLRVLAPRTAASGARPATRLLHSRHWHCTCPRSSRRGEGRLTDGSRLVS